MDRSEQLRRNTQLAFEVVHAAIADSRAGEEAADLGRDGGFVLVDATDQDLALANEGMHETLAARGERSILVQVNKRVSLQIPRAS